MLSASKNIRNSLVLLERRFNEIHYKTMLYLPSTSRSKVTFAPWNTKNCSSSTHSSRGASSRCNQITMESRPRPIHQPPRELRSTPAETEPSYSYEQESFLPKSEDELEDEFYRRLNSSSSQKGNAFWRTSSDGVGPSFSSMNMKQRSNSGEGEEGPVVSSPPSSNTLLPSSVRGSRAKLRNLVSS